MARIVTISVDYSMEVKMLLEYKVVTGIQLPDGRWLIARYGTNKTALKKTAKKLNKEVKNGS